MSLSEHWNAYTPDVPAQWNLRRVVHLHRRAGFAATWGEIRRDLHHGPAASIHRLLAGNASLHSPTDFAATANLLFDSAVAASDINRLRAAWFYRIIFGPDPLRERLTLFWHNHFATGFSKVRNVAAIRRQNDIFRQHCRGPFTDLLNAAIRDPALLIYLDAPDNRRGRPNENLARELLELFTLGIGNYSEDDVKETARALTGWTVVDGNFAQVPDQHDDEDKTILGHRGRWTGTDLIRILVEHPPISVRLATKLCGLFFSETSVPAIQSLAEGLRQHQLSIAWAVETILRSRRFFAVDNLGSRVLGPVDYIAGIVRALEMFDPPASTLALADWSARMGQSLFDPPNVGGWPGGRDWINPRTIIVRTNFVTGAMRGTGIGLPHGYDPSGLARRHATDVRSATGFHHRLLFGTDLAGQNRRRRQSAQDAAAELLISPRAQLG